MASLYFRIENDTDLHTLLQTLEAEFSAAPALLAVIRLSTGKLLASLILTPVPAAGAGALLLP